jgi:hypothetical protein
MAETSLPDAVLMVSLLDQARPEAAMSFHRQTDDLMRKRVLEHGILTFVRRILLKKLNPSNPICRFSESAGNPSSN